MFVWAILIKVTEIINMFQLISQFNMYFHMKQNAYYKDFFFNLKHAE
jgi:hypothetical protein